jgi:hypothetical protein
MSDKPRAFTEEEACQTFIDSIRGIINYWDSEPRATGMQRKEFCESVVLSILILFDGTSTQMPALDIVLRPHESDKQFHIDEGENWYEDGMVINDCNLHDLWYENKQRS